ncbi:MAG: hypothetical protein ACREMY_02305, partial [bacterium]
MGESRNGTIGLQGTDPTIVVRAPAVDAISAVVIAVFIRSPVVRFARLSRPSDSSVAIVSSLAPRLPFDSLSDKPQAPGDDGHNLV